MPMPKKVHSGQRVSGNISASGQNYLRRLMAKDRGSQLSREGGAALDGDAPGLFVTAKSTQKLTRGQWIYLTEPLYGTTGREQRFALEHPLKEGSGEGRLLAMAVEPVAAEGIGTFQIAGLCRTQVYLPDSDSDAPWLSAGLAWGTPELVGRQDDAGAVQIVWHDTPGSSAGDVWAIVRLPGMSQAVQAIEITGPEADDKEDGDELSPDSSGQWEGKILAWDDIASEAVPLGDVKVACPEYAAGKPKLRLGQVVLGRLAVGATGTPLYLAGLPAEVQSGVTAIKATLNDAPAQWPDGEEFEHGRQVASATVTDIGSGTVAEIDETVDIEFPHLRGRKIAVESGSVVSAVLIDDTTSPKRFLITSDYTTGAVGATVVKATLNDAPAQWPNGEEYEPGVQTISAEVTQVSSGGVVEVEELIDIEFPHVPGQRVAVSGSDVVSAVLFDDTTSPKRFLITSDYTKADPVCGLTYDEHGRLKIDPAPIAGPGLKASEDPEQENGCQLQVHAGTGLAIADGLGDGSVYFDAEYAAGMGLSADGSQLHAALGHALDFDLAGNIEVRADELTGPGTELGPGGTIAVKEGFAIQVDGGGTAVDSSQLAGLGTRVDVSKALEVVAAPSGGLEVSSDGVRAVAGQGIHVDSQISVLLQDGSPVVVVTKVECLTDEDGKPQLEITYANLALKVDSSGLYLEATI